jgi:hypothetical protein
MSYQEGIEPGFVESQPHIAQPAFVVHEESLS